MERPAMNAAAARPAHDHRYAYVLAVTALRGVVGQDVEAARDEINELHLGYGAHAHHRSAARGPDYRAFRDRRVNDALFAESGKKTFGHLECAAVCADVFAKDEDALVALHLFP